MLFMSLVALNANSDNHILYNQNDIIIHAYTMQIKEDIVKYFTNKYCMPRFQYFRMTSSAWENGLKDETAWEYRKGLWTPGG